MTEELSSNIFKKKYLIFDLDGTLIDTDEANFLAYQEAIKEVKNLNLTLLYQSNQRFTRKKLKSIIPNLEIQEYEKIINVKNNVYNKYLEKTKIITVIADIIEQYSQTHNIILATNSHKVKANLLLQYHNLSTKFDYIFYKENYNNQNKYKYALEYLNIQPNEIIIFENDKLEIAKALILGISVHDIIDLEIKNRKENDE